MRGAVRVRPTGRTLAARVDGPPLTARLASGARVTLHLVGLSGDGPAAVARFAESVTRDDAEKLRGAILVVPESDLPVTDPDEFYVRDLVGCRVRVGDVDVGDVVQVHALPANDVLEVRSDAGGESVLVPFTRDAVTHLDLPGRRITVRPDLLPGPGRPAG